MGLEVFSASEANSVEKEWAYFTKKYSISLTKELCSQLLIHNLAPPPKAPDAPGVSNTHPSLLSLKSRDSIDLKVSIAPFTKGFNNPSPTKDVLEQSTFSVGEISITSPLHRIIQWARQDKKRGVFLKKLCKDYKKNHKKKKFKKNEKK
jgi:hypothetical protein